MRVPENEALPPALQTDLETMRNAALLVALLPRSARMKAFMDMLPQALEEQLVADRAVLRASPPPNFTDARILRLAAVTTTCWNLMMNPDPAQPTVVTSEALVRGLHGVIGILQLHLGERLGLLQLVEGLEHPWDWDHPVHYRSYLPDLPEKMVQAGLWDPNPNHDDAFRSVERPETA